jgi:hypothetical protein
VPIASSSNCGVPSSQTKEFRRLLDLAFFTDFGASLDGLTTEVEGENKATIKMLGTIDSF